MGKAKLFKIRSIDSFPNVFQNEHYTKPSLRDSLGNDRELKGKWQKDVFKNDNPIILELACGKGDYALAMAKKYPKKNFIGIDSKGARIFTGAKAGMDEKLTNLVFVRMKIENITLFFAENEVDEIWITFPDPFPRKRDAKRRLTSVSFLERYQCIIKPDASINFKTDDLPLFHFTKQALMEKGWQSEVYKEDIYASPLDFEELNIQTYYEKCHLKEGRKIQYLRSRYEKG
ncbi:MAG: tRNA (guanosine(46)-N7)-methyltransferase TrmB [Bacteroidetes bacterium]|nr:tRNA (guanosine(46)-N7)-methyltransferase TrmB [Bacteroidota bacterium]